MPSIDVAMAASLKRGFGDVFVASLRPILEKRQDGGIITKVNDAKTAFSSWDNCMQVNYCKWPVIAVIAVGGLIIFSVIWCMIRCLCCGMACCCSCFNCLKCCGNCCGCCDPPEKKHKYLDDPFIPPNQGYKSQAPMTASAVPPAQGGGFKRPMGAEPPQYAEFDVSRKKGSGSEDELPAMPTWGESGTTKKAVDEEQAVEMKNLKPETPGSAVPLMSRQSPGPVSPVSPAHPNGPYAPPGRGTPGMGNSPYGQGQGMPSQSTGYLNNGTPDPYAQGEQGYGPSTGYGQGAYGQSQTSFGTDQGYGNGMDQGYGMAAGAMSAGQGRGGRSPRNFNGPNPNNGGYGTPNQGYGTPNQGYGTPNQGFRGPPSRQGSNDDYRRNNASPAMQGGAQGRRGPPGPGPNGYGMQRRPTIPDVGGDNYNAPQPRRSPAPPQQGYNNGYNAPNPNQAGPYGAPQRSYTGESSRNYPNNRPPPQRQYTAPAAEMPAAMPVAPVEMPSPELQNNSGFDFGGGGGGGYSRQQENNYQPYSPINAQAPGQAAYPGYKPYQPM